MTKFYHTLIYIALVFIISVWALFMFWFFYPYKTVDIMYQPYSILNKEVKQGNNVEYNIVYCKYTDKPSKVDRQFVDGIVYAVPEGSVQLEMGCHEKLMVVQVPKNLPTGVYHLEITVTFDVNPVRKITNTYKTDKFNVIK